MRAEDVTDTLDLALQASGCDQVHVVHKPRLLLHQPAQVTRDLVQIARYRQRTKSVQTAYVQRGAVCASALPRLRQS